jgi:hypothetical protein
MTREVRIYEEASALWWTLFAEPPPVRADGQMMLEAIMKSLPEANYERMASPHLRPALVVHPRRSGLH